MKSHLCHLSSYPFPLCDAEMILLWSVNSLLLHLLLHLLSHGAKNERKGFSEDSMFKTGKVKFVLLSSFTGNMTRYSCSFNRVLDILPNIYIIRINNWNQMVFEFRQHQLGTAYKCMRCVCVHQVWLAFARGRPCNPPTWWPNL